MPAITYSKTNSYFSFFNQTFQHVTHIMTAAWSKVSHSLPHLSFSASAESFYQQAGTELGFQHYQRWCGDIKQMERDLLHTMDEKKLSPKVVRQGLLKFIHHLEKNIVSPIYFHHRLNHLKQKLAESHYPLIFQTIIEETQVRLNQTLQQQSELALKYFYDDAVNDVVELSGKKIETNELLEKLSYYQTLVPSSLYEAVRGELKNFIQLHEKALAVSARQHDIYYENNIASSAYAALIKNMNAYFEEVVAASENPTTQKNPATHRSINWRFLSVAVLAGTSAYLYQNELNQAFTTANHHLNMIKQMPWHVGQQVDWSTGNFSLLAYPTLMHATLSYGLYQRLSLTEHPAFWSAITILWTTLPKSIAQVIELSSLSGTNGFVMNGVSAYDNAGFAISSGDVNGDSITDVLIGASQASPGGRTNAGASYVVFGSRGTWPVSLELSSLNGTNGFVMNGVNLNDWSGSAISSGDVNGDNITDVLIGASQASPGSRTKAGASYVVFGHQGTWPASVELSSLNGTNGFVMNGVNVNDWSGFAISSGDVNGDNITDVLIGASQASPGSRTKAGASYVVFGHRGAWPVSLELSSLNNATGFVMNGVNVNDWSGSAISSGDVNGDTIPDVLIGAYQASPGGRTNAGASYVVFGSRGTRPVSLELSSLNGINGFVMNGVNSIDYSGSVISSGDVNGDTIPDVLIGAYFADPGGRDNAGASYVVFGHQETWPASLELSSLNGTNGFVMNGVNINDWSGYALSNGDVNGDNITDVLIGAYLASPGSRTRAGASYVVFGHQETWPASLELSSLNGTNGFVMNGVNAYDYSGYVISNGDVNGDNISDVLIGAPYLDLDGRTYAGASYVIFGSLNFTFSPSFSTTGQVTTASLTTAQPTSNYLTSAAGTSASATTNVVTTATALSTSASTTAVNAVTSTSTTSTSTTEEQGSTSDTRTTSNAATIAAAVVVPITIVICIGGVVGFIFYRRRQQSQLHASSVELPENQLQQQPRQFHHSLPPKQTKQSDHKVVGEKYEILSKIYQSEAQALYQQEGLQIDFQPGKEKTKFQLGEGQFGKIKLARHKETKAFVVVKKIKGDTEIKASKDEAELQSKLKGCPNVMPLLDSVEIINNDEQRVLYQFMPLASFGSGKDLQRLLTNVSYYVPHLKNRVMVHVAKGLLTGLAAMHRLKIYHLDLKPTNVMFNREGESFLIDFGCAKEVESGRLDYTNGDTWYFSPERLASGRTYYATHSTNPPALAEERAKDFDAAKADAWALGLTLWELITKTYPFDRRASNLDKLADWDSHYFAAKLAEHQELKGVYVDSIWAVIKALLEPNPLSRLTPEAALKLPVFERKNMPFASKEERAEAFATLKKVLPPQQKKNEYTIVPFGSSKAHDENYAAVQFASMASSPLAVSPYKEHNPEVDKVYTTPQAQQTMFGSSGNMQSQEYNLRPNPTEEEVIYALVAPQT